jgi:phage shock protein A
MSRAEELLAEYGDTQAYLASVEAEVERLRADPRLALTRDDLSLAVDGLEHAAFAAHTRQNTVLGNALDDLRNRLHQIRAPAEEMRDEL